MASSSKREEVPIETRLEKMEQRMEERLDEMMAMLRQSLEDKKNRFNAVESKQQQATDEQCEHLVLLRENRTATELYRAEVQGANRRVEMMQDNLEGFRTDLLADAKRHELQVDAAVKQIQTHHTASSLADTIGRHDLDTTPPGSVYGAMPGEADRDAVRVGAHRPLEESKEEPATLSHYYQPPGASSLTGIIIGEQVPFTETLNDAPSTYQDQELDEDPEELNAMQGVADGKSYDRSKEACHGYLFHPNGCSYFAKGKPGPFSHDPKIGMVAVEAAKNNLLKMQK